MALWVATPKDEGFIAYHQGDLRCQCTYPPNTAEAEMWLAGWDLAEERELFSKAAELVFPDTPGECVGCGTTQYSVRELNLYPDRINECYACTAAKRPNQQ